MSLIRVVVVVLLVNSFLLLTAGCNPDSRSPTGASPHADTSKFIGTWVTVFDTSDVPPGTKNEKRKFWCPNGNCSKSDTFLFVNDSIYSDYEIGFEATYSYNSDSIYFYLPIVGTNTKILDDVQAYYFSNDTLILNPRSPNYRPTSIRISITPLPPKVFK